ncbi:MAG: hypothetical protein ACXVFT_28900 [Solirubrobacteraceae bacterium]
MEPEQDWCLNCGTAAPGRLGERPGWRAASTVIALALLLVLGAVGAGYAALTGDSQPQQTASAPPAAAPPAAAQTAPPAATTQPPAATTQPPAATSTTPAKPKTLPKVKTPTAGATPGSPITPTPTTSTPATGTGTGTGTTGTGTNTGTTGTGTGTGTTTTPADTGPKPIELNGDAGTVYDPFKRAKESGETTRALDDDQTTSWYVDPTVPTQIAVGYVVDLGKLQGVRQIELQTPTPGFRVEIYATDETTPPPDILDTRWSHIKDVSNVGAKNDGKQKIVLGAGTSKYRNVLLWFTQPPTDGPRLRITELKLLG